MNLLAPFFMSGVIHPNVYEVCKDENVEKKRMGSHYPYAVHVRSKNWVLFHGLVRWSRVWLRTQTLQDVREEA